MDSSGVFSEVVAVWKLKATEWTSYADGVRLLKVQQILFYRHGVRLEKLGSPWINIDDRVFL